MYDTIRDPNFNVKRILHRCKCKNYLNNTKVYQIYKLYTYTKIAHAIHKLSFIQNVFLSKDLYIRSKFVPDQIQ